MDGIDLLRRQALVRRNVAIQAARREYHAALKEIRALAAYRMNVPFAFQSQVDFAVLIKNYQASQETTRYSPAKITNIEKLPMFGNCDEDKISTSHIERFNLTYRMSMRRFTRLTNGHSKSLRHHTAMQALFIAWYNFGRKHEALKNTTPAMASKLTDHVWTIKELIERAAE